MVTRTCIATGQTLPTNSLIRFVASPDGVAVADLAERLPGRGAWVMANAASISKADSKGHFKRALGVDLADDADGITHIMSMLRSRVLSLLAMARRSGIAFAGAGKLLVDGSFDALLAAQDASERECRKLESKLGVTWVSQTLTAEELGQVFGRDSIAYVGLRGAAARGGVALIDNLHDEIMRLDGFYGATGCQN
ncbi:DUF448 domain-containing protein [Candidatus Puniceispirillum marinum]|jgi:predicted RNA-binding protein YlxR (DUF448 family)|uniref:YlxR domain-containing protein n=1 Tax=Puniceispirillum marinum (strain IMCC1322) TaxID=488538 RepID=D5BU77_PUNMI|nr:DUF448 domain-containing protein [Candidatus Puniceispirillum marinum]ADE39824.1 protein of unknown function DUF448 [Candidatus Puniceispirillum marinum IMCC1322]